MKPFLLEKVLNRSFKKNDIAKNLQYTNIVYKHLEHIFTININQSKHVSNPEINNYEDTIVHIDRNILIKQVVDNVSKQNVTPAVHQPENVVIEFSSPNIAKPFHVGHLRSTMIGNFIANINKYFNNNVTKLNYLGDWGTQFGLLQYGIKMKGMDINEIKNNPIRHLYEVYVETNQLSSQNESILREARQYFTDIEQGKASLDSWEKIRKITVTELQKVYERLGIKFDEYHWESNYNAEAIKDIILELETNNVLVKDDQGKKVAKVNNKDVTVLKSDNSTLYLMRDIAALIDRYKKFSFNKMLYVVDNSQTDHFAAVFDIAGRINKECTKRCEHIKFGRVRGISTRKGNVVFLNDILDEAKQKMWDKQQQSKNTRTAAMNDETCDVLGTTAVIINDFKQKRQKDYVFDWDKALQSEGDSGIKLQYLHCRLWSLEKNSGVYLPEYCQPEHLPEEIVGIIITELMKFENVLYRTYLENEACILVNYLFRLARCVNRMFNELKVKNVDIEKGSQRLLLFHSARVVLKNSLEILGVKPLYEM